MCTINYYIIQAYFSSASKLYFLIVRPVGRSIKGKEQYKIIGKTEVGIFMF